MNKTLFSIIVLLMIVFGCRNIIEPNHKSELNIISVPNTNVLHNDLYTYTISIEGNSGDIQIRFERLPDWLTFDEASKTISGIASGDNLGRHSVIFTVYDDVDSINFDYNIDVSLKQVSGGPWIGHFPHNWSHDGQPLIGDNSIIYSDAAGEEEKRIVSERVENAFNDIKSKFNIASNEALTFMTDNQKIDIYANRFNTEYVGGFAYNTGAIIISPDSPLFRGAEGWCVYQIEHEMMHVMEYLLEGGRRLILSEVWFREGVADYYAGNNIINNRNDMDNWLATRSHLPGGGNPIKIHLWENFPEEVANISGQGRWYPMFELAVRYLLESEDLNNSMVDVKNMFVDMDVNNHSFPIAFELNMGMSLQYYEDNFWTIMDNYL